VFAASEFAALSGPSLITEIAVRPDAIFGTPFTVTIAAIQINLSTTGAAPDGLSLTFADNVGADDTVVFTGSLSLTSGFTGPPAGPKDFDYIIPLQTPFLYDPSAGNLLLEVRNLSGALAFTAFDAQFASGDSVSRMFSNPFVGQDATSTTGFADTLGLVVRFTAIPPLCFGLPATIFVKDGIIFGGPRNGRTYRGVLLGTQGDDVIVGTAGPDLIHGFGGDDVICALDGDDIIEGGPGDDVIDGGPGNDLIKGQQGNDTINGGDGDDIIEGGPGDDVIDGGPGNDVIKGQQGNDTCLNGESNFDCP
jgi:Ca2+-binding RTX toxin-like protein